MTTPLEEFTQAKFANCGCGGEPQRFVYFLLPNQFLVECEMCKARTPWDQSPARVLAEWDAITSQIVRGKS